MDETIVWVVTQVWEDGCVNVVWGVFLSRKMAFDACSLLEARDPESEVMVDELILGSNHKLDKLNDAGGAVGVK